MNPFENIVPRDDELLINEDFIKDLSLRIKEHIASKRLIVLEGDYGSGKSLYLRRFFDRLKTKKEWVSFNDSIINVLKNKVVVKNKSLFIDDFDLIKGFNNQQLFELSNIITELLSNDLIIVIACRKDTLRSFFEVNELLRSKTQRLRIPSMSFDEFKQLVIKRLNESRRTKSDSIDPFTEKELMTIFSKSNGNPRMMLMLLNALYDRTDFF